jgi:hypothetical protein
MQTVELVGDGIINDHHAARRIGFEIAPTMDSAIGMAREFVGAQATIAYYHCPPVIMCKLPA